MKKKFNVGDLVLVKSCNRVGDNYSKLIGCRGKVASEDGSDYKIFFYSLPSKFHVGNFHLHDCGTESVDKYAYILKEDIVPADNSEPTLVISKDKKMLVEFIEETASDTFKGMLVANDDLNVTYVSVGDKVIDWLKSEFELATKDNIPDKWKHILPEPKPIEEFKEICSKCIEIKREDEKPKYKVIKLEPTENQERQYGVYLFNHMVDIVNGQTIAFINSKTSGGVIYGRKAWSLLSELKKNNPNKLITRVKSLKANGIKQISIRIDDKEKNEFTL